LHFLANLAYYRAWNAARADRRREQFWRALNGNFIDIAVLEWCKLFGDLKAPHHWSKCVTDQAAFIDGLHGRTDMSSQQFEEYREYGLSLGELSR
jgi:hypothetical protein